MTATLKGLNVLVLGLAKSGISATKLLHQQEAKVTISDIRIESQLRDEIKAIQGCYQRSEFGRHNIKELNQYDLIVTSPGIRDEKILKALEKCKEKVTTEVELGLLFYPHKVIAITGTNGKTTTGNLVKKILAQIGTQSFFCGNNGVPLCEVLVNKGKDVDKVCIIELSSFMLQWLRRVEIDISVVLNVSSHHVQDHNDSFDHYLDSKLNLARHTKNKGLIVLNALDPHLQQFRTAAKCPTAYFSKRSLQSFINENPKLHVTHYVGDKTIELYAGGAKNKYNIRMNHYPLIGMHNMDNLMAALQVAYYLNPKQFAKKLDKLDLSQLESPPYRLQLVYDKNKITIYNDAKSTNVMSVVNAIKALPGPIHLICGGQETHEDFHPLISYAKDKVRTLMLIGQAKERLNRVLGESVETFLMGSVEEALLLAFQKSRIGDQILFSPGFPSYDMFSDFVERGETFNKFIAKL